MCVCFLILFQDVFIPKHEKNAKLFIYVGMENIVMSVIFSSLNLVQFVL